MKRYHCLFLLTVFFSGCATLVVPPIPEYSLPAKAKVGVYVSASSSPTHTHVGTTIFNNFVKKYDYQWDLDKKIFQILKEQIESDHELEVVNLSDYGVRDASVLNFVIISDQQWKYNQDNTALREKLIADNIQAVISFEEAPSLAVLQCSNMGCTEHFSQGYGLFTRSFLTMDRYFSSASFNISAEVLSPPIDLIFQEEIDALNNYTVRNKLLYNFLDPLDFKNISQNEFEKIEDEIILYVKSISSAISQHLKYKPEIN